MIVLFSAMPNIPLTTQPNVPVSVTQPVTTQMNVSPNLTTNYVLTTGNFTLPVFTPQSSVTVAATTTVVTTSVTYTTCAPVVSALPSSPLEDPRVGWIHTLSKAVLISEMAKHGLSTEGSSKDLRKNFCRYWQTSMLDPPTGFTTTAPYAPFSVVQTGTSAVTNPQRNLSSFQLPGGIYSQYSSPAEHRNESTQLLLRRAQLDSEKVREILGLSPSADSEHVARTLVALVQSKERPTEDEQDDNFQTTQPAQPHHHDSYLSQGGDLRFQHTHVPTSLQPHSSANLPSTYQYIPPHLGSAYQTTRPNFAVSLPSQTYPVLNHPPTPSHLAPVQPDALSNLIPRFQEVTSDPQRSYRDSTVPRTSSSVSNLCDLIRKWNLRFDGRKDPLAFLERLEELIEAYALPVDAILHALPELLQDRALLWYRNCKAQMRTFQDFKHGFELQFLPPGYAQNLDCG